MKGAKRFLTLQRVEALGIHRVKIPQEIPMEDALAFCQQDPDVEYAEPNYYRRIAVVRKEPNDPEFGELWGLRKIDAPRAWATGTGNKNLVVAVLDTGADMDHEDLSANIWTNPFEAQGDANGDGCPGDCGLDDDNDGLIDEDSQGRQPGSVYYTNDLAADDDENGFPDDFHGWDFVNGDNNPEDDNGHGTHVSGTIGAKGDNNTGVVGVNWSVSIMPLKILDAEGLGLVSDEIEAIDYAISQGADIINASFSGSHFSRAEYDAIRRARTAGILFVAAAGNDGDDFALSGWDNDRVGQANYPASYDLDNIIAVAATDHTDGLAAFSNFGMTSVDVAAPGVSILSTAAGNTYRRKSGTSMAVAHVTGLAALIWAENMKLGYEDVKARILNGVDVLPLLTENVLMAGRINANAAMNPVSVPDGSPGDFHANALSDRQIDLTWTDYASNESGFKIERGPSPQGPFVHVATVSVDVESYSDTRFQDGMEHTYQVRAFNSAGDTAPSNPDTVVASLIAPSDLSAFSVSSSCIDLFWADNSSGESGFIIERRIGSNGDYSEIATVSADVEAFADSGLSASTTYYYRVGSFNDNGMSAYSNEAGAETFHPPDDDGGGTAGCLISAGICRAKFKPGLFPPPFIPAATLTWLAKKKAA